MEARTVEKNRHKEECLRISQAETHQNKEPPDYPVNSDVNRYEDNGATFSKSLFHNHEGLVSQEELDKMKKGVYRCKCSLKKIHYPGTLKLVSPSAVYSVDYVGPFKSSVKFPSPPLMASNETGGEMVELYNQMLSRDVLFRDFDNNSLINETISDLNKLSDFKGPKEGGQVTTKTVFRGNSEGDLIGPYVSIFFLRFFNQGAAVVDQVYSCYQVGHDLMKTPEKVLLVQNGQVTENPAPRDVHRYISSPRDGASFVHFDTPTLTGQNALNILYSLGCPLAKGVQVASESAFVDTGPGDITDLIGRAARIGLLGAWYHKWSNLRLRPEVLGLWVEQAKSSNTNKYELSPELMSSDVLNRVKAKNNNYILNSVYPEGSPSHPAYPAGHSVFIGAVVTILKAFFKEDFEMAALVPDKSGMDLIGTGEMVTVRNELDKLASNVAIFRNWAGVHYRSDADGIYLGEQIAINLLQEHVKRYPYKIFFEFHKRNGELIKITK